MTKTLTNKEYADAYGYEFVATGEKQTSAGRLPYSGRLKWAVMQDRHGHRPHIIRAVWGFLDGPPEQEFSKFLTADQRMAVVHEKVAGKDDTARNHAYLMWRDSLRRAA